MNATLELALKSVKLTLGENSRAYVAFVEAIRERDVLSGMVAAMAQEIADHRYDPKSMIGPPDTVADVIEDYRDLIEFAPGVVPGANTEATRLCPHCEEEQISLSRPCCRSCENVYRKSQDWDSLEELEARLLKYEANSE